MAVHHGREVVQTVGQCQGLWIGHSLPHLLDTTVNVAKVWIDALHGLAVNNGLQTEHTMSGWVVRTDIHHIVVIVETALLGFYQMSVGTQRVLYGEVVLWLVGAGELVGLRTHVEVLAQWMTLEVGAQEKSAHVWMTQELDANEVEHLALQQVSHLPKIDDCRNHIAAIHLLGDGLYRAALVGLSILKNIDTSETFLTEVFTDDGNKVVEMLLRNTLDRGSFVYFHSNAPFRQA